MEMTAGRRRVAVTLGGLAAAATVAVTALAAGGETRPAASVTAQSAAAAPAQLLFVSQSTAAPGQPTDLTIDFVQADGRPMPRLGTVLIPAGYELRLDQPADTVIGTLTAVADIPVIGVSDLTVRGNFRLLDPADVDVARAVECTGTATHAAALSADLDLTTGLPMWPSSVAVHGFIDPASEANAAAGYAYELRFCLRRLSQLNLSRFTTTLAGLVTNPPAPGRRVLSLLTTPYAANGTDGNPAGTTESRSVGGLTSALALARVGPTTVKPGAPVRVRGLLLPESPSAGRTVTILAGSKLEALVSVGTATTDATGAFAFTVKAPKKGKLVVVATFAPPSAIDVTPTGCASPAPTAQAGCVSATLGPAVSGLVRVTVKKSKKA